MNIDVLRNYNEKNRDIVQIEYNDLVSIISSFVFVSLLIPFKIGKQHDGFLSSLFLEYQFFVVVRKNQVIALRSSHLKSISANDSTLGKMSCSFQARLGLSLSLHDHRFVSCCQLSACLDVNG